MSFGNVNIETGIGKRALTAFWRHHLPGVMRQLLTLAVKAIKIINSMFFITIKHTWEDKCAVYSKAFITEIPLETNPFNRKITLKLLLIIVQKLFEILWWISTLLEWVPETKQIFTPDVKSVVMKNASSANLPWLLQIEKVASAFEWLLWNTHFSKQKNLLVLTISRNVCMLWDHSLREREKCFQRWIWKTVDFGEFQSKVAQRKKPPVYGDRSCV